MTGMILHARHPVDCPEVAYGLRELLARVPLARGVRVRVVPHEAPRVDVECPGGCLAFAQSPGSPREHWRRDMKGMAERVGALGRLDSVRGDGDATDLNLPLLAAGILLGWEEEDVTDRDEHRRWFARATTHPALFARPLADEMGIELGRRMALLGVPLSPPDSASVALTFDIDSDGMFGGRRTIATLRRAQVEGGLPLVAKAIRTRVRVARGSMADPHTRFRELHDRLPGPATFFVQVVREHRIDNYDLAPGSKVAEACRWLRDQGHEIGLHGSYATVDRGPEFLEMQCERFEKAMGFAPVVYRAHFLRHHGGESERLFASCGLRVDSSLGTPDLHGYRRGTSRAWFPRDGGPDLVNVPMHSMDVTLRRQYGTGDMGRALDGMAELLGKTRSVGGCHVFLSHPHNMEPLFWPGWEDLPLRVADLARERSMRFVTIGEHVREESDHRSDLFTPPGE